MKNKKQNSKDSKLNCKFASEYEYVKSCEAY